MRDSQSKVVSQLLGGQQRLLGLMSLVFSQELTDSYPSTWLQTSLCLSFTMTFKKHMAFLSLSKLTEPTDLPFQRLPPYPFQPSLDHLYSYLLDVSWFLHPHLASTACSFFQLKSLKKNNFSTEITNILIKMNEANHHRDAFPLWVQKVCWSHTEKHPGNGTPNLKRHMDAPQPIFWSQALLTYWQQGKDLDFKLTDGQWSTMK